MKSKQKSHITYLKSVDEIPDFRSEREAAQFWDTHSPIYIWDQLEDADIEIGDQLKEQIQARSRKRLARLIELDAEQMKAVQHIARRKRVDHRLLIKTWIEEGIAREQKGTARKVS